MGDWNNNRNRASTQGSMGAGQNNNWWGETLNNWGERNNNWDPNNWNSHANYGQSQYPPPSPNKKQDSWDAIGNNRRNSGKDQNYSKFVLPQNTVVKAAEEYLS